MNDTLNQSNFRKKIVEDDFRYSMKKVALAGGLTFVLLFLMNNVPFVAYIAYPVVLATGATTEMVAKLAILAYLLVLSYLLLYVFVFRRKKAPRQTHLPCPHCNARVNVFNDWKCDQCEKSQGVDKYITEGCFHCGKMLETYTCEHCNERFRL